MKGFLAAIGMLAVIAMLILVPVGLVAGGWGIQWVTAPFRGAVGAREKIQANADFRIQAYDSFYNQCSSIQSLEKDIDNQIIALAVSTNEQDQRIYKANITSISGVRDGAIARYNTESHKQWTVAQFKSTALVYELPTTTYITLNAETGKFQTGSKTVCVID